MNDETKDLSDDTKRQMNIAGNREIFDDIAKYYHEQSVILEKETRYSDIRFDQVAPEAQSLIIN